MPGTVKSELLPDADRSHKCDCQEKVSWKRNLPLDKSHFITETEWTLDWEQNPKALFFSLTHNLWKSDKRKQARRNMIVP